jgi:hypothetical protein
VTTTTDILYRDIQRLKGLAGPLQQKIRWLLGGTQVAEPGAVIDVNVGTGLSALVTAAPDGVARAGQKMITLSATGGGGGGSVDSVTAGDGTITIGGTVSDPTVAVTPNTFDDYGDAAAAQTAAEAYTDALAATLGTAATHNVPASGDASATEVVLGNDSRLGSGTSSPLTTKGDLWGFGSGDDRVPVGSDDLPLVADSAQTLGVAYKPLPIGGGGTGHTTATAAFDALAPSSPTKGDVLVFDGSHWVKHDHGSDGQIMQFDSSQSDGIANITSAFVPFKTLAAEILADSPMAFWKLDETSGSTFADSSGNGYDLTISNANANTILSQAAIIPTLPTTFFPYFGNNVVSRSGALGFSTPITGAWTVEFIIQFGAPGTTIAPFTIANNGETSADNIQIQIDLSASTFVKVEWETGSGTNASRNLPYVIANYSPSLHIVVVKTGAATSGNFRLYVNGSQRRDVNAVTVTSDPTGGSSANTYIGSYVAGATIPSDSVLAYMAVYNAALADARIVAHAQAAGLFQ